MKNIIKSIVVSFITLFFGSCFEDEGSYNHIQSNISEVKYYNAALNKTTVVLGDTVHFYPIIVWNNPEADTLNYDYAWVFFNQDTISTERYLHYVPKEVGTHQGYYVVKERSTGITTITSVSFTANSPYRFGWVILSELEGRTALSMLPITRTSYYYDDEDPTSIDYQNGDRTEAGEVFYNNYLYKWADKVDLYNELNPDDPLGKKPVAVYMSWVGYSTAYSEIVVMQEEGGNWVINGNNFSKYYNFNEDFNSNIPSNYQPVWFFDCQGANFMADRNNRIYWRGVTASVKDTRQTAWGDEIYFGNNAKITKIFEMSLWYPINMFFAYDEHNKALIPVSAGTSNISISYATPYAGQPLTAKYSGTMPDGFLRFEDLGDYKPLHVANIVPDFNVSSNKFMMLLEKEGKLYIQICTLSKPTYSAGTVTVSSMNAPYEFPGEGKVTPNSIFMKQSNYDSDYLFIAEGNTLYFNELSLPERGVKVWKRFDSKIVSIHDAPDSRSIGVALENGEFHIMFTDDAYFIGENGGEKAIYHSVEGLGKIVDVVWKSSSYAGANFGYADR